MLPTPAAAASCTAAVAMTVPMQLTVPATGARASGCAAGRNNAAAAQWAVWAPAAQQGPTVMLPTPAAAASCTAAVAHAGTDATHRGSNCCNSTAAHCTIPWPAGTAAAAWMQLLRRRRPAQEHPAAQPAATSAAQWAVWAPAAQQGPTVMLPTPAAAASCTAAVAHAGTDATHRASNRRKSTGCAAGRNNAAAAQWAVWAPAAQQGPTVMLPTPAAAASCTAAVAHAGTDATATLQQHGRALHIPWPAGTGASNFCTSASCCTAGRNQCSSVGSVGAGGPAGTDRDAADACRSGIMHRGSRTCRYRCNSPWQQPAQEHTAAQPAATTQLQLSGQCGRLGPSRTDRDAADACRSGIIAPRQSQ